MCEHYDLTVIFKVAIFFCCERPVDAYYFSLRDQSTNNHCTFYPINDPSDFDEVVPYDNIQLTFDISKSNG